MREGHWWFHDLNLMSTREEETGNDRLTSNQECNHIIQHTRIGQTFASLWVSAIDHGIEEVLFVAWIGLSFHHHLLCNLPQQSNV
jgi:hypothetical protein